ncbi:LysR family transcriptional regulator [Candidimonas nitroreducens]|uniref:LysR family transcriptional regulator n=1 Tax=Candidimonas nitroreducens TaxID=683354 RepID=A0A225LZ26_9BURK|nr:LysR substrate-binding domain-containing protein [Candidimonas nitroreducens]OWT54226.1 LysR family transcriptional regulator [Candidimonas nitroreducens]
MNLRQIEVFRNVMQTGSIKDAASLMHVSSPAVSKLLGAAERAAGLALFERVKGRLVPTPSALRLYEEVDQLWQRVERFKDLTQELAAPTSGSLHVAISPSLGATVVPKAATALTKMVPDASIKIDLLIPHLLVRSLVDGVSDIGLSLSPQSHPNLAILKRYPCELVCVMPAGHPLAARRRVRPVDLLEHNVISFPQAITYGISNQDLYGKYADLIHTNVEVRSGQTACWFCLAGAGVAIVDTTAVAAGAFSDLVVRPYTSRAKLAVYLTQHRNRPLSKLAEMFCTAFDATWNQLGGIV